MWRRGGLRIKKADVDDYGYRFYAPELGRWVSRDPIGEECGLNVYGFVRNGPSDLIDPNGLFSLGILPYSPLPLLCGEFIYPRVWDVGLEQGDSFARFGWVVQKIKFIYFVFDCDFNLIEMVIDEYIEAFRIDTGSTIDFDRWWHGDEGCCTKGYGIVSGSASYYNSDVAHYWPLTDPEHPANGLPGFPDPSEAPDIGQGDSDSFEESLEFSWNCCSGQSRTPMTHLSLH